MKEVRGVAKRAIFGPFDCPNCGSEIRFQVVESKISVKCLSCGLNRTWDRVGNLQPVDYLNKLADELRGKS